MRRRDELNSLCEDPNLWNNPEKAQDLLRERNHIDSLIGGYERLDAEFKGNLELAEMAEAEKDDAVLAESENALIKVANELHKLEIESLLSGDETERHKLEKVVRELSPSYTFGESIEE